MKQLVVFIMFLFVSTFCFALNDSNYVDVSKLSDTQRAALALEAAKIAEQNKNPTATVDQVDKWVQLGINLGKGLAGTARELGIAANEFIQTPVGKMTAGLIVWRLAGHDIVQLAMHLVGGPVFFVVMMIFWIWFFRKLCMITTITEVLTTNEKGKPGKIVTKVSQFNGADGYLGICIVGLVAIVGASIIMVFSY